MSRRLLRPAFLLLAAIPAAAQAPSSLTVRVQIGSVISNVDNNGTLNFAADQMGGTVSAALTILNRGGNTITVNSLELTGSTDFILQNANDLPLTLGPGQSFLLGVRYVPSTSQRTAARLALGYTEVRLNQTFVLNFTGSAPELVISYTPPGGNATPLLANGVLVFPQTLVDTTATAAVSLLNRGTATGFVNGVAVSGSAFQLTGAPLPNTPVDPGREVRFNIQFTPRQLEQASGVLTVEAFGQRLSFTLQGTGAGPVYAYEALSESGGSAVAPNQVISVADTAVGERSSVLIRVRNTGNADGKISAIAVQGPAFQLTDVPFLPVTLAPDQSLQFTLIFAPKEPGRSTGKLRIGDASFDLAATALGPILNYAYLNGPVSTSVSPGGTINLTPAAVGRSSSVRFVITNTGTTAAAITAIALPSANNVFSLSDVPALPVEVAPGSSLSFGIQFNPIALGTVTAPLRIDSQTFTVAGIGTSPAPLPDFRFEGPAGTLEPMQQPAVGIVLANPYPLRVNGTLTLAFNSEVFANDPTVQFATGGRTVSFTIPPNATRAIFPGNATSIRLQTGTVAGSIVLTPSFQTEGGVDLTPANPLQHTIVIPLAPPRILSALVTNKTTNGFTLQISGYATSRSVTQIELQFTPIAGETLANNRLTLNVETTFLAWYQSQASQQFGSLFTASVPITLTGDVSGQNLNLSDTLQAVAVTLSNRQGTSNAVTVGLR